jgi:thymidylate kinase
MKGKLICIIGPDGVGKSTQVNLLINNLKKSGKIFEYRWLRFHHLISIPILGIARLFKLSEFKTLKDGSQIGYHYFSRSKLISFIYSISLFLDTLIFTLIKVTIPITFLNKNLACDRFIYDTLVDLMISTGNYDIYNSMIGKLFLRLIPSNAKIFMILADEKTLKSRRNDVMYDKNITLKVHLYKKISEIFKISIINGKNSSEKINFEIMRLLNE